MAFVPSYWRETPSRYRLEAKICTKCSAESCKCKEKMKVFFPPRIACSPWCDCKLEPHQVTNTGKLLTYTVIHIPPTQFSDEAPYVLGIVEMDDNTRLTAQIVDIGEKELKAGIKLRIEFRKIQQDGEAGILMYGYKMVPI